MTKIVGLTGQTGSGKSSVAAMFREQNIPVIDADLVSRRVVTPQSPILSELKDVFGEEIILPDGGLDRKALGIIVFSNEKKLLKLDSIMFPVIMDEINGDIDELKAAGHTIIVIDAPQLFEADADKLCDFIVGVVAPEKTIINRIMERDALSYEEAKARLQSQHKEEFFGDRCDYIIDNSGTTEELKKNALNIIRKIEGDYN